MMALYVYYLVIAHIRIVVNYNIIINTVKHIAVITHIGIEVSYNSNRTYQVIVIAHIGIEVSYNYSIFALFIGSFRWL